MKKRWMVFILFAVAVAALGQAPPPKPLTPLEQTLTSAEKNFIEATKKGDAEFFKRTLTDDYSMVSMDGQLYDRQEILGQLSSGGVQLTPYNFKVVSIADGVAIVTYDVIMQVPASEDQGPPPRYQHWSSVWVKQADAWKLKFQQTTPTHWGDW
jgi:hypothetical protein